MYKVNIILAYKLVHALVYISQHTYISMDREGLETEVPSKYYPCISAVLIEAYFLTRGLNMNNS